MAKLPSPTSRRILPFSTLGGYVQGVGQQSSWLVVMLAATIFATSYGFGAPPKLSIYHVDVNTCDATLVVSPDGHAVLIDAGNKSRRATRIVEFLNHARTDGVVSTSAFTIATHYDAEAAEEVARQGDAEGFRVRSRM